jgi:glycosyltransferase involved in cell wall biosynthesis
LVTDLNGISIVIPAYNEEKYLPETLRALNAARAEFAGSSEIIVVDNVSTDRTREVAEQLGARVISHGVRNISSVRNAGLREARFDLVLAIDADCTVEPNALREIFDYMSSGKFVGGSLNVRLESPKLSTRLLARSLQWFVLRVAGHNGAVFFFLREDALAIGGFSEKHLVAEDSVFTNALREHGKLTGKKFGRLPHVIVTTTDRKDSTFKHFFKIAPHVWRTYRGHAVDKKHFDYWYNPKR